MTLSRVQPIIPTWRKLPFDDPGWLFDFKYDCFRALCYLENSRCLLVSRNGNHLARFDELGGELGGLLDLDEATLDGEVIAADVTGRPQFYELLRRTRAPAYVAFDILWGQHRFEPDPAEMAERYGAELPVRAWVKRLKCSQCGSRSVDFVLPGARW